MATWTIGTVLFWFGALTKLFLNVEQETKAKGVSFSCIQPHTVDGQNPALPIIRNIP